MATVPYPQIYSNREELQKYDYLTRAALFKSLWINTEIFPHIKEFVFNKYPQLYELNICIKEFRQIFEERYMPSLFLFIERYKDSKITALCPYLPGDYIMT